MGNDDMRVLKYKAYMRELRRYDDVTLCIVKRTKNPYV